MKERNFMTKQYLVFCTYFLFYFFSKINRHVAMTLWCHCDTCLSVAPAWQKCDGVTLALVLCLFSTTECGYSAHCCVPEMCYVLCGFSAGFMTVFPCKGQLLYTAVQWQWHVVLQFLPDPLCWIVLKKRLYCPGVSARM